MLRWWALVFGIFALVLQPTVQAGWFSNLTGIREVTIDDVVDSRYPECAIGKDNLLRMAIAELKAAGLTVFTKLSLPWVNADGYAVQPIRMSMGNNARLDRDRNLCVTSWDLTVEEWAEVKSDRLRRLYATDRGKPFMAIPLYSAKGTIAAPPGIFQREVMEEIRDNLKASISSMLSPEPAVP